MTKTGMSTESVSRDKERMRLYKAFAVAFSYPAKNEALISEYDSLFRANEVWLYTTEYKARHDFQKSRYLSDIMAFYRAFGVEPDKDRPDSLSAELEFMHYLIFKRMHALEASSEDSEEKAIISLDAQKKFFTEHLYPAARKIAEAIISKGGNGFYKKNALGMLEFLESERRYLNEDMT